MRRLNKKVSKVEYGRFCEIFGEIPKNKILEFLLEMRELDFSIGDIARETRLNRATTYNIMEQLIKNKYVILTRKVSGGQLYKLNMDKREVQLLIKIFNLILDSIAMEYKEKSKAYA